MTVPVALIYTFGAITVALQLAVGAFYCVNRICDCIERVCEPPIPWSPNGGRQ